MNPWGDSECPVYQMWPDLANFKKHLAILGAYLVFG